MRKNQNDEDNIIEMPVKKKNSFFRILKLVLSFCAVAAICFGLYFFREDIFSLSPSKIKSFFQFNTFSNGNEADKIEFERSSETLIRPFKRGYAVAGNDKLAYLDAQGNELFGQYIYYANPALLTSDSIILEYDRGGNGFIVAGTGGILHEGRIDGSIISACVDRNGGFALVTDESGCRSAVTIFDKNQNKIYKWLNSVYYISMVKISPNGKSFASACVSEETGDFASYVAVFDITDLNSDEPAAIIPIDNSYILALSYLDNKNICAITENSVIICSSDGNKIKKLDSIGNVSGFAVYDGQNPVVAAIDYKSGQTFLYSVSSSAEIYASAQITGNPRYITKSGEYTAVMTDEEIFLYDKKLKLVSDPFKTEHAARIALREDGTIIAVYAEYADICKNT